MPQKVSIMSFTHLLLTIVICPSLAGAASFDCRKATSAVETVICGNETLSKLDDEMARVYTQALFSTPDRESLKKAQREWVKKRRNNCRNVECLKTNYSDRIKNLQDLMNVSSYRIEDAEVLGKWESYGTAFYKTGAIRITPIALFHAACKCKFNIINKTGSVYHFKSNKKNTCYFISDKEAVNYINVILGNSELNVRYYSGHDERTLLGEGTYSKVK